MIKVPSSRLMISQLNAPILLFLIIIIHPNIERSPRSVIIRRDGSDAIALDILHFLEKVEIRARIVLKTHFWLSGVLHKRFFLQFFDFFQFSVEISLDVGVGVDGLFYAGNSFRNQNIELSCPFPDENCVA